MIEVTDLTKKFASITAVDNVSFKVNKGDVLGFLGPNGAGKSTTLKMIAGYMPPSQGTILVDEQSCIENPIAVKSKIGYMPETNPLYKEMTAREFLSFNAEMQGITDIEKKVDETLVMANLREVSNQLIETLSKGYRSRLSFAAAIVHDPPILLLDEPTDGLDPNQKNEIRGLIKSLSRDKAIIVSTHILEEVEAMCTKVIIISEGKLVLNGTPADLRRRCESDRKIVVSVKSVDKEKLEGILSTNLTPLSKLEEDFERFRIERNFDLQKVDSELKNANISFKEIFYYNAPLDEAFRKLTKTKE